MKCLRRLLAVLGLCVSFSALGDPTNAPSPNSNDWLEGTWDVTYQDSALGSVRGQATARIGGDGWIQIRYVITDPRDGSTTDFAPFNIGYASNVLTMEFFGKNPSTAISYEGG